MKHKEGEFLSPASIEERLRRIGRTLGQTDPDSAESVECAAGEIGRLGHADTNETTPQRGPR